MAITETPTELRASDREPIGHGYVEPDLATAGGSGVVGSSGGRGRGVRPSRDTGYW